MASVVFSAAIPLAVFFGVFFMVMDRLEKRLPAEAGSVPAGYYAAGFIVAAVCGVLTLIIAWVIALSLPTNSVPVSLQAVLDEQCGKGQYTADASGYSSDPILSWGGEGASCYILDGSENWICHCPTPTDEKS
jgi:hypothetical protein